MKWHGIEDATAPMKPSANDVRPRLISLVMPAHNEQGVVTVAFERLEKVLENTAHENTAHERGAHESGAYEWELVFVNDGSLDNTWLEATAYKPRSFRLVVLDLSRRFGKEAALSAGLRAASGDAVIPIDADLQDPPELVLEMVRRWEQGAEVVVARRRNRSSDTWAKRFSATLFYRAFNLMSDVEIPENVGDFRLMDRSAVDAVNSLPENRRFMKGLFAWVGFQVEVIEYTRPARSAGNTKFNALRLMNLAIEGVTSFSTAPLRLVTYIGMGVAIAAMAYGSFIILRTLIYGVELPGYASIISLLSFFSGIQLLGIGIVGEYVGRSYMESKSRPPYIVRGVYRSGIGQESRPSRSSHDRG